MKLNYSLQFNKDKNSVLEAFCDPAFFEQHQTQMQSKDFELISHEDDGTRCTTKFRYQVESDVPAFAKKVLGDSAQVVHTETWDRSTGRGEIDIDVATMPGTMTCQAQLQDDGDGCRKEFNWEINVKIPLVGGKIEKVVAADIESKKGPDQTAVNQILAQR